MKLFTIGFTKTTAENFFERLKRSGAKAIVDVRLNNIPIGVPKVMIAMAQ